ncbi:hypothetical protein AXF42_Ash000555 [Apostasia shenzhenica]|uniref:Uncharacterized protein n=1 Tax=Apostasia shenzhenica TaxID=1088818 RepID=A0A2I0AGQ2_9ASPA|nr:hypothetical protein AXF42_Ash000555 [Apostasia shenzhenica]
MTAGKEDDKMRTMHETNEASPSISMSKMKEINGREERKKERDDVREEEEEEEEKENKSNSLPFYKLFSL